MNEGDLLAEIETDKATMGFETPEEGYLAKILVPAGTKNITIGSLVCIIVEDQGNIAAFQNFKDDGISTTAPTAAVPTTSTPPPQPSTSKATPSPSAPAPSLPTSSKDLIYASPLAKRLAAERNLSLQVFILFF